MSKRIRGGRPRTEKTVYGSLHVDKILTVPEGETLRVPEWGLAPNSGRTIWHEFPAGTQFRLLYVGDPHSLSVTEILD